MNEHLPRKLQASKQESRPSAHSEQACFEQALQSFIVTIVRYSKRSITSGIMSVYCGVNLHTKGEVTRLYPSTAHAGADLAILGP